MAAVVVAGAALLIWRPWDTPEAVDPLAARVAEVEAATAAGDARNLTLIGDAVAAAQTDLLPLMTDLQGPMPSDGAAAVPADEATVAQWRNQLTDVAENLAALPSGSSEYNVSRNGFAAAVDLLDSSLRSYELAIDNGAADEPDPALVELADTLRAQAVRTWENAGTQLDIIFVEAQRGHMHISLPIKPDGTEGPETDDNH